jgi:hypothetical protein
MGNLPQDMREEVGKARVAGGGNYIQHGDYIAMVKKWFYQKTQDRCIILECTVIQAHAKTVYHGQEAINQTPNAPGSDFSDVANFDGDGKLSAPSNSRAPVLGLFGFKEGEVPDAKVGETLDYCLGDNQPAAGMLVKLTTYPKEIRSRKGSFITGRTWECVNKPGEGLNRPEFVKARLDAFKSSPEKGVEVALSQFSSADATTNTTFAAPPAAPTGFTAPTPPAPPTFAAPTAEKSYLVGWTPNPQDPKWFYRLGGNGQVEQKLETDLAAGR